MNAKEIGTLIQKKRNKKGLSQSELAALLHVTTTAVSKWERGNNYPDIQNLKLLSETLDIPPMKLLPEDLQPLFSETALDAEVHGTQNSEAETTEAQISDTETPEVQKPDTITPEAQSSDTEAPEVLEPDNALPVPDNDATPEPKPPPSEPLIKKFYWRAIAVSLLCIILLGSITIAYWMKPKTPSFTIIDEYYDDYEGQKAYYIIAEYSNKPVFEDYDRYENAIETGYADYFKEAVFIIVIYYKKGTYDTNSKDPFADNAEYSFLYPSIYNTLEGDDLS